MYFPGSILKIFVICTNIRQFYSVYWNISTSPIVIGEDVTLTCYRGLNFTPCSKCTRRWYGGKYLDFLSFNSLTANSSKYGVHEEPDKFDLIIKNFNIKDMNIPYKCSYGFDSYKRNLTLETDFEIHPTNETFSITDTIDKNGYLKIQIQFEEVHPLPTCSARLNGKPMDSIQTTALTKDIFFNLTLYLQHKLMVYNCNNTLDISCVIGEYTMQVLRSTKSSHCKAWMHHGKARQLLEQKNKDKSSSSGIPGVVIGVLAIVITIVVLVVIWKLNISKNPKNNSTNDEVDFFLKHKGERKEIKINVEGDSQPTQSLILMPNSDDISSKTTEEAEKISTENNEII